MKTYLTLWFNSEGASPTLVERKLKALGFESLTGGYDLEYSWESMPTVDDILELGNTIQRSLKGSKALFKMETA